MRARGGPRGRLARFTAWSAPFRDAFGVVPGTMAALKYYVYRSGLIKMTVALPIPDSRHPIFVRAGTSDTKVYSQHVLRDESAFPTNFTPRVILDGGANIGLASIAFAVRWPEATIVAVEFERSNFELLVRNTKPYANILPVHAALWSHSCAVAVDNEGDEPWAFQAREATNGPTIDAVSIDDLFSRMNLPLPDLIKLDIEGAERELLASSALEWLHAARVVAVELHEFIIPGITAEFTEAATRAGYSLSRRGEYMVGTRDGEQASGSVL